MSDWFPRPDPASGPVSGDAVEAAGPGWTIVTRELPDLPRHDGKGTLQRRGVAGVQWIEEHLFRTRQLGVEVWFGGKWWWLDQAGDVFLLPEKLTVLLGAPCWCLGTGRDREGRPCDHCRNGGAAARWDAQDRPND